MTDFPDWQAPQAHASAIAATGAPLLRLTTNQATSASTSLPASTAVTLLSASGITQPGFEGVLQLYAPAASGTVPFAMVTFAWADSFSGLGVGTRHYYLTAGNGPGSTLPYYIAGPCRGDQLSVTVTNLDPAVTMTLAWAINQTSHIYEHDKLAQALFGATAPNGFTNPGGDPAAGILAFSRPAVNHGTTVTRLCAVYGGRAVFSCDNTAGGTSLTLALTDPGTLYSVNAQARLVTVVLAASSSFTQDVALPYGPVVLQITNSSGTINATPNVGLVALDY